MLRLGAYQVLRTRIPPHAAVATAVDLAPAVGQGRAGGFVNAVLRRVTAASWDEWVDRLAVGRSPLQALALRTAHPDWIARRSPRRWARTSPASLRRPRWLCAPTTNGP